jgi:hypothetical protein
LSRTYPRHDAGHGCHQQAEQKSSQNCSIHVGMPPVKVYIGVHYQEIC